MYVVYQGDILVGEVDRGLQDREKGYDLFPKRGDRLPDSSLKLAQGRPADLVIFNLDQGWKVDADKLLSKSKNTPFDGRLMQGTVSRTVIDGRTVFVAD